MSQLAEALPQQTWREALPRADTMVETEDAVEYLGLKDGPWSKVKDVLSSAGTAYFENNSLESERMYALTGIKFFKKYLPTSGDFVMRKVYRSSIMPKTGTAVERLKDYDRTTRIFETVHLGMIAATGAFQYETGELRSDSGIARMGAYQLICNIYPIMLQRYNRLRISGAVSRHETRELMRDAYESSE